MKHSQTKLASLTESLVSNAIGFVLTIAAQLVIFEDQKFSENLFFSSVLLVLHIIRSYCVRRGFNAYVVHKAKERKKANRALKREAKQKLKIQEQAHEERQTVQ